MTSRGHSRSSAIHSKLLKKDWTKKEKKKAVLENRAKLLEERIATAFGRDNPIKMFSASQILQAIDSYEKRNPSQTNPPATAGFYFHKGISDDRMVLIKTYYDYISLVDYHEFRDIVVSSMMSTHRNVLKLLGCCLEFPVPAAVYEYAEKGCLNNTGGLDEDGSVLPWKNRLKIAKEIASAVAYMHTAFPTRIIHRDIKPTNILVSQDYTAKLTHFSYSISIPEGEPHVEDAVCGTIGFRDPHYGRTRLVTEKTDVYSFGVLLLVFLTGKRGVFKENNDMEWQALPKYVGRLVKEGKCNEVADPAILGNVAGNEPELHPQLQAFLELAQSCVKSAPYDRPSITEVAKELVRIERSIPAPQF